MPENVQRAKDSNFTDVKMREKRESETNEKFKYAPEKSTYIVIEGHYNGPRNASSDETAIYDGDVKYTISWETSTLPVAASTTSPSAAM